MPKLYSITPCVDCPVNNILISPITEHIEIIREPLVDNPYNFPVECVLNKITGLRFNKGVESISINNTINLVYREKEYKFTCNYINKQENKFLLKEEIQNISKEFILPMLKISRKSLKYDVLLLNTYLYSTDDSKEVEPKSIYLKYRFIDCDDFDEVDNLLQSNINFKKKYNPSPKYVVYEMLLPSTEFLNDIYLITQGKYSQTSKHYKDVYVNFHNLLLTSKEFKKLIGDTSIFKEYKEKLAYDGFEWMVKEVISKLNKEEETIKL